MARTSPASTSPDRVEQQGPRGGRTVLVELHGQGPLEPAEPKPIPVPDSAEDPPPA